MNRIITFFVSFIFTGSLFAQEVRLNDSVIFINNKPVAFYTKTLSNSTLRYNMEVYNNQDYILIKAEVIEFRAPIRDLKSFFYYELTFPPLADTFAVYVEDDAFPLVMANIIKDYQLISNNELNKEKVNYFIANYQGGPYLEAKIKYFTDYLNLDRNFNNQVQRDRTKPVYIINNEYIYQDGKKIGEIGNSSFSFYDYFSRTWNNHAVEIFLLNGSRVPYDRFGAAGYDWPQYNGETALKLLRESYEEIKKNEAAKKHQLEKELEFDDYKNKIPRDLGLVCSLIANYAL